MCGPIRKPGDLKLYLARFYKEYVRQLSEKGYIEKNFSKIQNIRFIKSRLCVGKSV